MFAGRLTPAPEGLIESRPNLRRYSRKWPSDEIAIPAGRADLRLSWRKGVAGRHPRIGSGLSGQASAFYRCSSYTPRLRTFFIVQEASWQARGWAGLRAARVGKRDSGCARSSPRPGASDAARSAFVPSSLAAAWAPMPERGCRFHMRGRPRRRRRMSGPPDEARPARGTSSRAPPACFGHGGVRGQAGSPTGFRLPQDHQACGHSNQND